MVSQQTIYKVLTDSLKPQHLEVIDESHLHSRGNNSHFKVVLVSERFAGLTSVRRQQLVYAQLKEFFAEGLHALSQHTFTPQEWQNQPAVLASPMCSGAKRKK